MHLWLQSLRGEALTPVWYPHVSHWSYGSLRRGIWFWPVLNINHSLWFIFNVNVCLLGHKYVLIFDSNHLVQKPLWRFIPMMLKFISSCNSSVLLLGGTVGSSSALQLSCHPCWKAYSWSCQALWCETVLVWFCPLHAVFSVVGLSACWYSCRLYQMCYHRFVHNVSWIEGGLWDSHAFSTVSGMLITGRMGWPQGVWTVELVRLSGLCIRCDRLSKRTPTLFDLLVQHSTTTP